jgi:hypothetical protein
MEDTPGEVLHCQFHALVELHKKRPQAFLATSSRRLVIFIYL